MAKNLAQIFIKATDQTKDAFDSLKKNTREVGDGIGRINGLLAGLGAGVSVGGFALLVKQAIDAQAALDDLQDSTALTVETLSSLQQTARIGGHSFETVTNTATKFAKSVAEAAGGNKELLRSFEALGISQERLRTAKFDELYTEFAGKIANAENKTYAIAYATDLAGKSAAQALPFFKDLAETGLEQARVTTQQAEAADNLQKQIGRMGNAFDGITNQLATSVVPTFSKFLEDLDTAYKSTGNLVIALGALGSLGNFGDNPAEQIRKIDEALEKNRKAQGIFGGGLITGPLLGIRESGLLNARGVAQAQLTRQQMRPTVADSEDSQWGWKPLAAPPGGGTAGAPDTAGLQLIAQLQNQLGELNGTGSVVDQTIRKLTDGTKSYTLEVQAAALAIAGDIDALKRAKDAREAYVKTMEEDERISDEIAQLRVKESDAQAKANVAAYEMIERVKLEAELLNLSNAERERRIALLELEKNKQFLTTEQLARYTDELNAAYSQKKAAEAYKEFADEAKRRNEQIGHSLTDALLRGFEDGKDFAQNFRDTLKNMFSTLVLRPIIQPIAQAGAGLINSGLSALGLPGSGGSGGGNLFNMAGQASSLFGSNLFGGLLGSSAAYGAAVPGVAIGSQQAAMLAAQTGVFGAEGLGITASAAGGGGGLMGAAGGLASIPGIGWIAAALMMASTKQGRETLGAPHKMMEGVLGNRLNTFLDPIGGLLSGTAQWKDVSKNLFDPLGFFMKGAGKPAVFTGMDATGTITRQGLQGGQFFGNDANQGYRWQTTDHWATSPFNAYVEKMFSDLESIGGKLGLDTSRLSNVSIPFSARGLSNTNSQQIADEMAAQLGDVSDMLALQLMPKLRDFSQANETATQTLLRLVTVQEQLTAAEAQQRTQLSGAVRGLPGQLGITGLQGARDALSVSEYVSPMSRLTSARGLLDSTFSAAMGGDLAAVNSFPQVLQQALSIGRDVGASGPAFQSLFMEGNRQLNELLSKQQATQTDILQGLDLTLIETSNNQIAELKKGFGELIAAFNATSTELRRLREAA